MVAAAAAAALPQQHRAAAVAPAAVTVVAAQKLMTINDEEAEMNILDLRAKRWPGGMLSHNKLGKRLTDLEREEDFASHYVQDALATENAGIYTPRSSKVSGGSLATLLCPMHKDR